MSGERMSMPSGLPPQSQRNRIISHLANNKSRQVFLLKCRRQNITPRFILDKVDHLLSGYRSNQWFAPNDIDVVNRFLCQKLLNMEIGACCQQIDQQQRLVGDTTDLPQYHNGLWTQNQHLNRKFKRLLAEQTHLDDVFYDDTFIKNFSNVDVPKDVLTIFGLGPKFAVAPSEYPILDLVTDVEHIVSSNTGHDHHLNRTTRGHMLFELTRLSKIPPKHDRITRFLSKSMENARKFLKNNPDIMVTVSDKGSVTIISSKNDYMLKMAQLVHNPAQFEELNEDPTNPLESKIYRKLLALDKKGYITRPERFKMNPTGTRIPRIYGQPKYHKTGLPIRPIVSTIKTPAYKLSRFLATILKKSYSSPMFSIKNSKQFVSKIRKVSIPVGHILVSYDVVNCFGNIPTALTIDIIENEFDAHIKSYTGIPKEEFMQLLKICLNEANYFGFDGKIYRQLIGMFMGSSLAPILVERVIEAAVKHMMQLVDFPIPHWFTYVDDHLSIIPANKVDQVSTILNGFHPDVQFTIEVQDPQTNSINFLDTTVFNVDGKIKTNWFCKEIASNRLINFYSAHPKRMIYNTAVAFAKRVYTLSHKDFHQDNNNRIRAILAKNNFPPDSISMIMSKATQWRRHSNGQQHSYPFLNNTSALNSMPQSNTATSVHHIERPPTTRYASLQYVPHLSDRLTNRFRQLLPDVKIAHKPAQPMRRVYTNLKQKLGTGKKSCVVYKVDCLDCDGCYIGETTARLEDRMKQHQGDIRRMNVKEATALVAHAKSNDHCFDFENVSVLHHEEFQPKLKLQEINQIILHREAACNYKSDSARISPAYYNLVLSSKAASTRNAPSLQHTNQILSSTLIQ